MTSFTWDPKLLHKNQSNFTGHFKLNFINFHDYRNKFP